MPPSLLVINITFYRNGYLKDKSAARKVTTLEVKFKYNINRVIKEIAGDEKIGTIQISRHLGKANLT